MEDNIKQVVKDVKYLIAKDCNNETIQSRIENYIKEREEALAISRVSNCGDKHLSKICDKEGHQMSELWYVNQDRIPFQLEHSDKCCICGYENNSI